MDRTESHNVAGQHPEITGRMARRWHEMTAKVLMAPEKERLPVAATATATAKRHNEWSTDTDAAATRSPKSGKNKSNP
jgi:hypothetical protein